MNKGKLFLIPNVIAEETQHFVIPPHIRNALPSIQHFLVEDIRTARRYLSSLKVYDSIEPLQFEILDKKTKPDALKAFFNPIAEGFNIGIISESGCPGVADPGALAVQFAHRNGIEVVPLVGPSSILLALMGSGLNGQHFAFHGYLPIDQKEAGLAVKAFEKESSKKQQTQIFIETPYRNNQLMRVMLNNLADTTLLSISINLTSQKERIQTHAVKDWRKQKLEFEKVPVVFLFLAL